MIVGASGYLFHQFREVTKMVTKQKELVFMGASLQLPEVEPEYEDEE